MSKRSILGAVLLLTFIAPTHPAGATVTPGGYARRLDAALAATQSAQHASGTARSRDIATAERLVAPVVPVQVGGTVVRADLRPVRDDLSSGRLSDAVARLTALRAALHAPSAQPSLPDRRREKGLDDILAHPPFTAQPSIWTAIGTIIQRLLSPLQAVLDAINRLLQRLFGPAAASIESGVPIVAGLLVAAVLIFATYRSFGTFVPQATIDDEAVAVGQRLDAAAARARAAALAASGDYREAARYTFLATLLALDEAGRLRIDTATGNRDVLRQARAVPHLADALTPVVRGFELFWFGHAPLTPEDYERYRRLNERALEVAR